MQLDLDKRYFGEYVPPERCACDCAFISHSDGCATEVGLYQVVFGDVRHLGGCITENFATVLKQHPLCVILKNHRMVGEFECDFRFWHHPDTSVYSNRFDIYFTPYFKELIIHDSFIGYRELMNVFKIHLFFKKDKRTGLAYVKAKRAYFHSSYTNYDRRSEFFEKLTDTNYRIKCHDIKPVGTKQAWLDTVRAISLYTTAWEVIVSDVVNEIAPQFFKEQA